MGLPDISFFGKVVSWIGDLSFGISDLGWVSCSDPCMADLDGTAAPAICYECHLEIVVSDHGNNCQCCGRLFCWKCMYVPNPGRGNDDEALKFCRFCFQSVGRSDEVASVQSAGRSEEADAGGLNDKPDDQLSPSKLLLSHRLARLMETHQRSSAELQCATGRSDEDDDAEDDSRKSYRSPSSEFSHDVSDLETCSISTGNEFYSFKSSPLNSPNSNGAAELLPESNSDALKNLLLDQDPSSGLRTPKSVNETTTEKINDNTADPSASTTLPESESLLEFQRSDGIWTPPPPLDEADDKDISFFEYDPDEDAGGASFGFKPCSDAIFQMDEKPGEQKKQLIKASVHGHFQVLVSQLLKDQGVATGAELEADGFEWLGIVSQLAWDAANFVQPDTRRGGSMDPCDYVKVKCVPSGSPSDSALIQGIVCTRNVKHKRMVTHHSNPKILIIGGSLENQKEDKLASIGNMLDNKTSAHLDVTLTKIEVQRPNVVLVEKSVSSHAVNYMLGKGISLVSNIKRPLLERISRCTDAYITELDDLDKARTGVCQSFHIEKVAEEYSQCHQQTKKPKKSLMYFEGCPRRLGCTVLLKGTSIENLKKVKDALYFAIFGAYHLSLQTSFLADEGATIPEIVQDAEFLIKDGDCQTNILESHETDCDKVEACSALDCVCTSLNKDSISSEEESHEDAPLGDFSVHEVQNEKSDGTVEVNTSVVEKNLETVNAHSISGGCFPASEHNQSILVSLSKGCVSSGITCERPQLLRIKFYGCFDKPLGKYLRDNLFDQEASRCQSCKESADAHVLCYTHMHGSLTIRVKQLDSIRLPGEHDGKIWMWHRCLKCADKSGVPPAGRRVIMSNAAWGLSFGKFLELSLSNHSTANRVASCGHSLQRDCLRFFGSGNMVAFFRYDPVDILSVRLPPHILEFSSHALKQWFEKEAVEVSRKTKSLYDEISCAILKMERKITMSEYEPIRTSMFSRIKELREILEKENEDYTVLVNELCSDYMSNTQKDWDILELNYLRRSLLIDLYVWENRFCLLDSMLKEKNVSSATYSMGGSAYDLPNAWNDCSEGTHSAKCIDGEFVDAEVIRPTLSFSVLQQTGPNLYDKIDLAWTGTEPSKQQTSGVEVGNDSSPVKKTMSPMRFYSFDSAAGARSRAHRNGSSQNLSSVHSLVPGVVDKSLPGEVSPKFRRVYSQSYPRDGQNLKFPFGQMPSFVSLTSETISNGARLLLPPNERDHIFVAIHDNELSSIISYALSSKNHIDFVSLARNPSFAMNRDNSNNEQLGFQNSAFSSRNELLGGFMASFSSSNELSHTLGNVSHDSKQPHFRFTFDDDSSFPGEKAKFLVTCYFAEEFSALRNKCCPSEMDFIRSLSRCKKWSAQGGKSNVYFAKSLDDRLIIKQVTRTELESFELFASQYFDYMTGSTSYGSPTCLAKILGIYQVVVKQSRGREVKMDLMVMENLFYGRDISRVYDLKGSSRSRYISDTKGSNKVLLDLNLIENLQTNPIFLGSKAKRLLERAVWNDTAFLASVDVMDYSLLVGVDSNSKELVIGIIDFMRQYTWDKHLETWVKASGILGGSNATPTVVSPEQYKKRFRKAMSNYFLTVPEQWSS